MYQVTGTYTDYQKSSLKSSFYLNADQGFNYTTWKAPIHWSGTVGSKQVKFTQVNGSGSNRDDYDWTDFPKDLEPAISDIVKAIDDAMRIMD
ncbi:hypothetical protein FBD94_20695 [Pedobacter hiemivivus]|uniref:Uncharacterized protein n=1 Tax=Pedobacter hiemivivus TaxID=2530454 RepID=A0A4U1G397_9SPHI|nr:hypothetical protein [Pedobacter hiemivivus]TKC57694.1 hypothetical protein FBD94_20695 [Pedobacter hiemivivus]